MVNGGEGQGGVEEEGESLCPHPGGIDGLTGTYYLHAKSIEINVL